MSDSMSDPGIHGLLQPRARTTDPAPTGFDPPFGYAPAPDRITSPANLPDRICRRPRRLSPAADAFPMRLNSYFLSLLRHGRDPLARQVVPDPRELEDPRAQEDPLAEEAQSPAPLIVHRYPGRVVFLVSNQCAVHCRYCMRKRRVGPDGGVGRQAVQAGIAYIRRNRRINEVILSGGDPLMLEDAALLDILKALQEIPHVRMLRIHTRVPGVWPGRVTPALIAGLARFHPLYVNIQFNHPDEITTEAARACSRLADAGLPLGSQTVLLKGINDDAAVLHTLMEGLLAIRVRPYYLHQIDRVVGTRHFQVPVARGLDLMAALRGRLSGMAMPHYMIDLPGGRGKMELLPDAVIRKSADHWVIRNYRGRAVPYPLD